MENFLQGIQEMMLYDENTRKMYTDKDSLIFNKDILIQKHEAALNEHRNMIKEMGEGYQGCLTGSVSLGLHKAFASFTLTPDKCLCIKDLQKSLNTVVPKHYLLCRTLVPPFKLTCVHTLVDDPTGLYAVRLCLYNYTNISHSELSNIEKLLPVGTVLAILNPYYKTAADGGVAVRCDNPSEVVILDSTSHLLKGVVWKGKIPKKYRHKAKVIDEGKLPESVDECKEAGNKFFAKGNYDKALELYNEGLKLVPNNADLLSNKCIVNLKLKNFENALQDAEAVLKIDSGHLKAKYRKALSLLGLRKYKDALNFLISVTENAAACSETSTLDALKYKLADQLSGLYDMLYFMKNVNNEWKTYPGCAEYLGPVKLVEISDKGRGMITTKEVKAGELIIVSKAFAFFERKQEGKKHFQTEVSFNINMESKVCYNDGTRTLMTLCAQNINKNPALGKEFYHLYAGPELGYLDPEKGHQCDLVDMKRIEAICTYNTFSEMNVDRKDLEMGDLNIFEHDCGIWLQPSYLNHRCINCNAFWITMKDFMFVRATRDIPKGCEVYIPYIPATVPYRKRMETLNILGIKDCKCELCLLEKSEPESIHDRREVIIKEINSIPTKLPIPRQHLISLKRYHNELTKLRCNGTYNFTVTEIESILGQSYLAVGDFLAAAECYKRLYYLSLHFCPAISLTAAQRIYQSYNEISRKVDANKWKSEFLKQYEINYGPCSLVLNSLKDEFLQSIGDITNF